jgi:hypothetical protein
MIFFKKILYINLWPSVHGDDYTKYKKKALKKQLKKKEEEEKNKH